MSRDPYLRRRSPVGRFFLRLFLAVLGLLVGLFGYTYIWLAKTNYTPVGIVSELKDAVVGEPGGGTSVSQGGHVKVYVDQDFPIKKVKKIDSRVDNYLIVGIDSRGEEIARSDTMMILSIDKRNKAIKLSSLMRDIQVSLPGREDAADKLNAAYAFGGIGLLINTINEDFKLDIQKFMLVDFWSSVKIVDEMGGVEIPVQENEVAATNDVLDEMNNLLDEGQRADKLTHSGEQLLNGAQAIAWARVRSIDSDHARTGRQRMVVGAILNKFSKLNPLRKLQTATTILEEMGTNMRPLDLMGLGISSLGALKHTMDYKVPENESMYTTNTSNWNIILNWDEQVPALHKFIYEARPED